MLAIRLLRTGKKHQPSFKVVVTDKDNPPTAGKFVEAVGFWNPLTKERVLKGERAQYWLSKGAVPSDTVYNMLVSEGVLEGKKRPVHAQSKKQQETAAAPEGAAAPVETPALETPAETAEGPVETEESPKTS